MYGENIKCFALIQADEMQIIFFESLNPKDEEVYRKEIENILTTRGSIPDQQKKLQKMHSVNGVWYFMKEAKSICYFILSNANYKMVKVASLINEINIKVKENIQDVKTISAPMKNEIYHTLRYYDSNPEPTQSQLNSAKQNIDNVSSLVKESLSKIIANTDSLNNLEEKSSNLQHLSKNFVESSILLEKQIRRRKLKNYMIFAMVLIVISLIIYFSFFYGANESSE